MWVMEREEPPVKKDEMPVFDLTRHQMDKEYSKRQIEMSVGLDYAEVNTLSDSLAILPCQDVKRHNT